MNMNVREILENITKEHASDIFVVAGRPLTYKVSGKMHTYQEERMKPDMCRDFVTAIYELAGHRDISQFETTTFTLPQPSELMIPDAVMELANTNKGMVLVTGPAGGGKSTTLACLIDKINTEQEAHIITLEDPLEYLHTHKKSIVSQREICTDTENYLTALRASLRQSPDVILLGEMRDYETINTAMPKLDI